MAGSDRGGRGVALAAQPSLDEPRHARWRSVPAYAVGPAVALITAPILARALGDSGRGTLASLLQPLTIVDAAIGGGLPLAAAYYVSRGVPSYHVFRRCLTLGRSFALFVFLLVEIYAVLIAHRQGYSVWLPLSLWSFSLLGFVGALARGSTSTTKTMRWVDAERAVAPLLRLALVAGLLILGIDAAGWYAFAFLLSSALALGLYAIPLLRNRRLVRSAHQPAESDSAGLRSYAWSAWVGILAVTANARLDQALMPLFISSDQLGHYAVAVTGAEIPLIVATIAARDLLSMAARRSPRDELLRHAKALCCIGWVMTAAIALVTPRLLPMIFGAEYQPAVEPALVLLLATAVGIPVACLTGLMQGAGRPGPVSRAQIVGAVLTVVGMCLVRGGGSIVLVAWVSVATQVGVALMLLAAWHSNGRSVVLLPIREDR